jgi:hypothetical protein
MTYRIVRSYFNEEVQRGKATIKRGLTLEEAREHCRDPETSSRTATSPDGVNRTARCGPWFDGYEEE